MARVTLMAACSLMVLLLAVPSVFGTDHTVGGSSGWTLGGNYDSWASGQTFTVGDNLVFTYDSTHGVDTVNEDGYKSCSTANALKTYTGGNTKIALTTPGKMYFICPTPGHCSGGMKLAINVVAAGSTPTTPAPSGSKSPSTPSTTTPATGSSPPPPAGNGAVGGFFSAKQLMGSLVASLLILAFMC
ncbi:basic blue protein-like [Neltuma alba]|uniref:basic blue protein-like n=1 Tax=Neltuma alba TaxID=207710 RepID=UPI0010A4931D|nr:basic blue protein-like [Prosopis alba]XP_028804632.1 basic blue protein-like [Prosopis alba]XP_028804633.1 basic blue protein-like [Prosopis alba]